MAREAVGRVRACRERTRAPDYPSDLLPERRPHRAFARSPSAPVASGMLDHRLRHVKERWYGPAARLLARWTPALGVTAAAFVVTLAAAAAAWQGAFAAATLLWLAGRILDGLDGVVARVRGEVTPAGGYLDMVLDTVGYAAIPLALAAHHGTPGWWAAVAVLLASFYLNTVSWGYLSGLLAGASAGAAPPPAGFTSAPLPRGIVEGFETVVLYTLILALPAWSLALVWVMVALVLLTVVERVAWGIRRLR